MSRAGEGGFTLVELLVSLAITGATAGLLAAALGTGGSVARRLEAHAAAGETVAAAQAILRERIERLLADAGDNGAAPARAVTAGTAATFTFVAPAPLNRPGAGLQRYRLAVDADGRLALAATDADANAAAPLRWRVDPLIGDVSAVSLAYFGPDANGPVRRWQSAWIDRLDPPELVRLRLRFGDGDPRRWPDLVVRPAATVSTACALDPNTGGCRAS